MKLEPEHLIHNFDDGDSEYIGIGVAFPYEGKMAKVAIRLENDLTGDELKAGIRKLSESVANPKKEDSGVIFDNSILTGKEIVIRCEK